MTFEEEGDLNHKATRNCTDNMIKMDAGMALREVLLGAKMEGRITYGVYPSVRKLGREPDRVMLCIHADSNADEDVALHIHFTLMEAFCREHGIRLLKVGCHESLAKVLHGDLNPLPNVDALDNAPAPCHVPRASTEDFVCLLVDKMVKTKSSACPGILRCYRDECLSVLQSSSHSPPDFMATFHSSFVSCDVCSPPPHAIPSSPHPNALRLAPPRGSRLPVTARQCANQLAHSIGVFVPRELRNVRAPSSHSEGTGASVLFNWVLSRDKKRCTSSKCKETLSVLQSTEIDHSLPDFTTSFHSFGVCSPPPHTISSSSHPNAPRLAPPRGSRLPVTAGQCANQLAHSIGVFVPREQRNVCAPSSHSEGTGASVPFNWMNSDSQRCTSTDSRYLRYKIYATTQKMRNIEIKLSTESKSHDQKRKVRDLKKQRINKMTKKRVSNQEALRRLKVTRQTCCSRNQVLECIVEFHRVERKVSKPNRKKMRRNERKRAYNRMRNGKVVEFHMGKEERRCHDIAQKNIQSHTARSLSTVIKNMQDKMNSFKEKENKGDFAKSIKRQLVSAGKSKRSVTLANSGRAQSLGKHCSVQEEAKFKNVDQSLKDTFSRQCWLCDQVIETLERSVPCDGCNIWYHVNCMGFSKMEHILASKSVSWMCRKCGKCNYAQCLLYDLGISTDKNVFEMSLNEVNVDDESVKVYPENESCIEDGIRDSTRNNVIQEIIMAVKILKEEVC